MSLMTGNVASCFKDANELPICQTSSEILDQPRDCQLVKNKSAALCQRSQDTHYANR
jgi:hypothetical protein